MHRATQPKTSQVATSLQRLLRAMTLATTMDLVLLLLAPRVVNGSPPNVHHDGNSVPLAAGKAKARGQNPSQTGLQASQHLEKMPNPTPSSLRLE